jgi:uncharacterized protein (TIGR03086 family)
MDIVDMRPAAGRLAELVTQVADGELGQPTPCPSYTVGDLVDHIGGLALAFTAAARKETSDHTGTPPAGDGSRLEAGWRERIDRDLTALALAWQDQAAWDGMTQIGGGDAPGEIAGLSLADELVVHGWDLARATGRPYEADLSMVDAARRFLEMFASPDAPPGPEVPFGPSRDLPAEGPALDRLVALAGRDPHWPAAGIA